MLLGRSSFLDGTRLPFFFRSDDRRSQRKAWEKDRSRSRQTSPTTAPRMMTTPMAISQDMSANTTPIGPYFLSSEITVPEKMNENTTSIPTQKSAVATAEGNRARHDTLAESRNHIVSHQ